MCPRSLYVHGPLRRTPLGQFGGHLLRARGVHRSGYREKRERLSTLNAFMHDAGLPSFLRYRLREYIFEANEAFKEHNAHVLMDLFSPVR